MKIKILLQPISVVLMLMLISTLIPGCAEQPVGYSYEPRQSDHSLLARTTLEVINAVYKMTDESTSFLEKASLTDDYGSILSAGWQDSLGYDTLANEIYLYYFLNYIDQKYSSLRFDPLTDQNAIRTPSNLTYRTAELKSYQNRFTSEFYWDASHLQFQDIEYSNSRQDHLNIDGWSYYKKIIQVEEELEIAGGQTISYTINLLVTWYINIQEFSIDSKDQSSRLTFSGLSPVVTEAGDYLRNQVTGEITIDKDGKGFGELSYYGEPSVKIYLTSRSHSFQGYYTIADEDHKKQYQLVL